MATTWAHAVTSKEAYAPFGETYNEAGTPDRSFTGQDQDTVAGAAGSGVYDYLFRKYDPAAGRWLSPDPKGWGAISTSYPQSFNRYAYVLNNPMNSIDPDGQACVTVDDSGNVSVDNTINDPIQCECPMGCNGANDGAIFVDGYTSQIDIDYSAENNLYVIYSVDSTNQAIESTTVALNNSTFYPDDSDSCTGGPCTISQSEISINAVQQQLSPTSYGIQALLYWMAHQTWSASPGSMGAMNPFWVTVTGTNWCGPGGFGTPVNGSDWACAIHDFSYAMTGNTYPNNLNQSFPALWQLHQINQQLCNNVSFPMRGAVFAAFSPATSSIAGCYH